MRVRECNYMVTLKEVVLKRNNGDTAETGKKVDSVDNAASWSRVKDANPIVINGDHSIISDDKMEGYSGVRGLGGI